jgi:hypothetical protein
MSAIDPSIDATRCLRDLYSSGADVAERAYQVAADLMQTVQAGHDYAHDSATLETLCSRIADIHASIQASHDGAIPVFEQDDAAGHLVIAEAQRYVAALGRLCSIVRQAEEAALLQLHKLSPDLDASIRGKQMISAYRQLRAS